MATKLTAAAIGDGLGRRHWRRREVRLNLMSRLSDEEKRKLQERIDREQTAGPSRRRNLKAGLWMKIILIIVVNAFFWIVATCRSFARAGGVPVGTLMLSTFFITVGGIIYIKMSSKREG